MAGAMRRPVLRILLNAATVLSLLLCVAATGLWWWGRTGTMQLFRTTPLSLRSLTVTRGEICIGASDTLDPRPPNWYRLGWTYGFYPDSDPFELVPEYFPNACQPLGGFFFGHAEHHSLAVTMIILPMGFVVPLFAILPLGAGAQLVRRRRRARRLAAGCCIT
jgi:hypothetical protein